MQTKFKRVSKRTFAYIMSVLMIIQAVYIPSFNVYAGDVEAPSIGENTGIQRWNFNRKTIDVSFYYDVNGTKKGYMVLTCPETGERNETEVCSGSPNLPSSKTVEALGVSIKWEAEAWRGADVILTTPYMNSDIRADGRPEERGYAASPDVKFKWTLESKTDGYKISHYQIGYHTSYANDSSVYYEVSNKKYAWNDRAMMAIGGIHIILTDKPVINLGDIGDDLDIQDFPEVTTYHSPAPDMSYITDTRNGKLLSRDLDYTINTYGTNYNSTTVVIKGKGLVYGGNSLYYGETRKSYRLVNDKPEITQKPQGKDITWTGNAQALVNQGATLSVYGQEKGTGKLIAKGNNYISSNGSQDAS